MDVCDQHSQGEGFDPAHKVIKIEGILTSNSMATEVSVEKALEQAFLHSSSLMIENCGFFDISRLPEIISKHLQSVKITFNESSFTLPICLSIEKCELDIFVFRLQEEEVIEEEDESGEFASFQVQTLPHVSLHGLWEALVYGEDIKRRLLDYVYTAMLYTQKGVNVHVVGWNRVVLLHGPPGTGKTSLCKALAHQLSLRLRRSFVAYDLIEINAHSLFSKWFSESGKLVMKMFASIREFASDPTRFVCILIDEVESLTAARTKAMSGSEPSDAIRVVNAVLTELDKIKRLSNVLVLTTSNITGAIDEAFLDRADIVQYIGPPNAQARYEILAQCMNELISKKLIQTPSSDTHPTLTPTSENNVPSYIIPQFKSLLELLGEAQEIAKTETEEQLLVRIRHLLDVAIKSRRGDGNEKKNSNGVDWKENELASLKLLESAIVLDGLSGRALRKVPFVATSTILHGSANASPFRFAEAIGLAGSSFSSKGAQGSQKSTPLSV